jgi:hypothetical protein
VSVSAQAAMTWRPVDADPVKASLSTPEVHSAAPVSANPESSCTTGCSGIASENRSASQRAASVANSLGLRTTALPAASAGASISPGIV